MKINRFGKAIAAVTSLVIGLSLAGSALALTQSDIAMLQAAGIITPAQAASLSASITPATPACSYVFTTQLTIGSRGTAVVALQQFLVAKGYLVMPAGVALGYYGSLTRSAVGRLQLAAHIDAVTSALSAGYGQVGPYTRAYLNANCGPVVVGPVPVFPVGSTLNVTLAPTSPASSAVIAGQAAADIAEFKFTNTSSVSAVVTNVTLQRDGISSDASLTNVYLYKGANRITDSASVVAGKITFNSGVSGLFTVAPGDSVTIAVKADIATSPTASAGQIINVYLTNVTSNVPVSASYPIFGASFTVAVVNDLAAATSTQNLTLSGGTVQVGSINQTLWSSTLTISVRPVWLKSFAVKFIGSASYSALQNLSLYASGVKIGTATGVDANGMITFDLSAAPYKVESSRQLEVRADVVSGSSRTFSLSLQNASDLQLVDSNYNVAITVGIGTPTGSGSGTWTINGALGGFVTFSTDSSLSGDNIVAGATNVTIAKYTLKAYGEAEKITSLVASTSVGLDNVSLYANGLLLASGNTATGTGRTFNLGSQLVIQAGTTVTLELRADIMANGTNIANGTSVIGAISGVTNNTQGQESSQLSTTPSLAISPVNGPTMTVSVAGLTLTANPGTLLAVPNTNGVKIGAYTIQAGSSEDVRITSVVVALGGAAGTTTNISSLYVQPMNGTASTIIGAPTASNNFNVDFTIAKNTSKVIDVYANLGNATGTASTSMTVFGSSQSSPSISAGPIVGQAVSIGQGAITAVTKQPANGITVGQFVVGGQVSKIVTYNFVSTNGSSVIKEMYFNVATGTDWITVNGVTVPVVNGSATTTNSNGLVTVPQGFGGANADVIATYSTVGIGGSVSGDILPVSVTLKGIKYTSGNLTTSSTTISSTSSVMTLVYSKPGATVGSDSNTGNGSKVLARVTVSADAAGAISLLTLPISITATLGTTASTTGVYINGAPYSAVTGGVSTTSATATGTLTFTGGYRIEAGAASAVTFEIRGNISGGEAGVDDVQTSLGASSLFTWGDINGSSTLPVASGTAMFNYPTNSAIVNI